METKFNKENWKTKRIYIRSAHKDNIYTKDLVLIEYFFNVDNQTL